MSHQNTPHLYNKRTPGSMNNDNNQPHFNSGQPGRPIMDFNNSVSDSSATNPKQLLNAYIYDFLVKSRLSQTARIFANEADLPSTGNSVPSSNKDTPQMNSSHTPQTPNNSFQQFQKDNNIPKLALSMDAPQGFLFEWWQVFWDIFQAKNNRGSSNMALQYYQLQMLKQNQKHDQQGVNLQNLGIFQNGQMQGHPGQQKPMGQQQAPTVEQQQQQQRMMLQMMKQMPANVDPQQQQQFLAGMNAGNNMNMQQQLFLSQQHNPNRIQQSAQSQMNNLRQQAAVAQQQQQPPQPQPQPQQQQQPQPQPQPQPQSQNFHDMSHKNSPVANQRMNQMMPQNQHAQQPMNSIQNAPQQQMMPNQFNQPQPSQQIVRMNTAGKPGMPGQQGEGQMMGTMSAHNGVSRNMNALQDYQMQLMLLEKQNKKRLDIARNNGGADVNGLLGTSILPPHSQQGMNQDKNSPATNTNSPVINSKTSPTLNKKKEPPTKRGRKPSVPSNTGNMNNAQPSSQPNNVSNLKHEYSTPLTPTSETTSDSLTKRKRKNQTNIESPKSKSNKTSTSAPSNSKSDKNVKKEADKKPESDVAPSNSSGQPFQDTNGQNDQIFPVEILGNSNGDNHNLFGAGDHAGSGIDDIDFDFNQFLDGNGEGGLNEGVGGFNWGGVDAIESTD